MRTPGWRTPYQRRNLLILRDEILPGIEEGKLQMRQYFHSCDTPSCAAGFAFASKRFPGLGNFCETVTGLNHVFGISDEEELHIFGATLPNDPSWLAANITDLLEGDK